MEAVFRFKETCFKFAIKLSKNGYYKNTVFGVSAGWLALVVCLPPRPGILSDISKDLAKLSADWYNSS
jgi:hypothetical protein